MLSKLVADRAFLLAVVAALLTLVSFCTIIVGMLTQEKQRKRLTVVLAFVTFVGSLVSQGISYRVSANQAREAATRYGLLAKAASDLEENNLRRTAALLDQLEEVSKEFGRQIDSSRNLARHAAYQQFPTVLPRVNFPVIIMQGSSIVRPSKGNWLSLVFDTLFFRVGEDRLLVKALITDRSGRIAAVVNDDRVHLVPGRGYDFNANAAALEVVDDRGDPIFQMLSLCDGHILVTHYLLHRYSGDVLRTDFASPSGVVAVPAEDFAREYKGARLAPLFAYPGIENFGRRLPGRPSIAAAVAERCKSEFRSEVW